MVSNECVSHALWCNPDTQDITQAQITDTVMNQSETPGKDYYGKRNSAESTMSENAETHAADWRLENPRFDAEAQVAFERARSTAQGVFCSFVSVPP